MLIENDDGAELVKAVLDWEVEKKYLLEAVTDMRNKLKAFFRCNRDEKQHLLSLAQAAERKLDRLLEKLRAPITPSLKLFS
jgi:glycerate kinase